jgi:hypothetical protein
MMYKDKAKQRQAVREATRRYRAKNKHSSLLAQKQRSKNAPDCPRMDDLGDTHTVIPSMAIALPSMMVIHYSTITH